MVEDLYRLSIYMYEQLFALTCISLVCLCWIWLCACKAIQLYQMTSPLLMGIIPIIPSLCSSCQQVIVRCVCERERVERVEYIQYMKLCISLQHNNVRNCKHA